LDIEDLLDREPVAPNPQLLGRNIREKTVLVTGAGGSIGSELCRQIAAQSPALLVLLDHSEYALYTIHHELDALKTKGLHACELVPILANVRDEARVLNICKQYRPHTIYHAAAYKHVPMVEANPGEGVLNNVFGTLNMVKAAIANQVKDFVLISTDKAVRPTNIMGATKRVAEMILQAVAASTTSPFSSSKDAAEAPWQSPTRFSMVRFGNVLGSSGSVIPLFRQQISKGGPVTVTHPEVSRYFMTIPEAAQLVLQAGAMAEGGDVFVLDMGEPIKILEIARRMVTLSGLSVRDETHPDADIELIFTGLRPGEKIHEELLIGENTSSTEHKQILRAREEYLHWPDLQNQLQSLMNATCSNSLPTVKSVLNQLFSEGTLKYR
jgi:FlaA1/EpsC-like NDP-sugar epimerase